MAILLKILFTATILVSAYAIVFSIKKMRETNRLKKQNKSNQ